MIFMSRVGWRVACRNFLAVTALWLGGCWQVALAQLVVEDGYVRGLPPGQEVTAAFMTLRNAGEAELRITGASSPVAERAEFHAHRHVDGMMRMQLQPEVILPARAALRLEPGRLHLMLIGLHRQLQPGETVPIILQGDGFDRLQVELPVVSVVDE